MPAPTAIASPRSGPDAAPRAAPLVLDLDGTLLRTDVFLECLVAAVKRQPACLLLVFVWLLRGRAHLKRRLIERTELDVALLPLNQAVIDYAERQHAQGREVHLATATDQAAADAIAARVGFIAEVFASDGARNLKSRAKAEVLAERFPNGFVYAGDARADLAVWERATGSIYVGRSSGLKAKAAALAPLEMTIDVPAAGLDGWRRALRLHQWAKNTLVFAPLILSAQTGRPGAWLAAGLGFLALGLAASAGYLINDLIDLPDDRGHWSKRNRPLASGLLPIASALAALPLMLAASLALGAASAGWIGAGGVLIYLATTLAYSLRLKRIPILDVTVLALLFTFRLGWGALVVHAPVKPWLFIFAMFLFFSLSLAKRDSEISRSRKLGAGDPKGRGYTDVDRPVVAALGAASAVASVLVMVLYLLEEAFGAGFYRAPLLLWAIPVFLTLWLGRVWLLCGRGELDDDPVAFAVKDPVSLALGLAVGLSFVAARIL